MALGPKTHKIF